MISGVAVYEAVDGGQDFVFRDINKAGLKMGYYTLEDLLGKRLSEVYPGVGSMGLLNILRKVYESGEPGHLPPSLYEDSKVRLWRENYVYKLPSDELVAVFIDKTAEIEHKENLNHSREELRRLTGHIQDLREEEKKKIAMEIHDELGQKFAALKMNVSVLQTKLKGNNALYQKTRDIQKLMNESMESMRRIMKELRPGLLDDLGLIEALKALVKDSQSVSGIAFEMQFPATLPVMSDGYELTLFRIVQEAITNILRHSRASKASLCIEETKDHLLITISDNGKGIRSSEVNNPDSFGISGMRERIEFIGGELRITGGKNGTKVRIKVRLGD